MCGSKFTVKGEYGEQMFDPEGKLDWIHQFNSFPAYGSVYDDSAIEFHLCDQCLSKLFKKFKVEPDIDDAWVPYDNKRY